MKSAGTALTVAHGSKQFFDVQLDVVAPEVQSQLPALYFMMQPGDCPPATAKVIYASPLLPTQCVDRGEDHQDAISALHEVAGLLHLQVSATEARVPN